MILEQDTNVLIVLLECIINSYTRHYSLIVLLEYIDLSSLFESMNE